VGKLELQVLSGHKVKLGWPVLEVNKACQAFLAQRVYKVRVEKKVRKACLEYKAYKVNKAFLEFLARKARAVHKEKKVKVVVTAKTDCCQS
jgi:hypothetical protein